MEQGSALVICADLSHSCHAPLGNDPGSDNRATPMTGMGRYIKRKDFDALGPGTWRFTPVRSRAGKEPRHANLVPRRGG
jgi:hypothetical protein